MRILIFVDMEGISGIDTADSFSDPEIYRKYQSFATNDVNAAIKGILKIDSNAIIDVFDAHGLGDNLLLEKLHQKGNYIGGGWMTTFYDLIQDGKILKYDTVILLGQHAAEGTVKGFMSHTNTGHTALRVNGNFVGEACQVIWLFGEFDIPVSLVVGDLAVTKEVRALTPAVPTLAIKEGQSWGKAKALPIKEAQELITKRVTESLQNYRALKISKVKGPVTIETYYSLEEMAIINARYPRFVRVKDNVVRYVAEDFIEAWFAYNIARDVLLYTILKELDSEYAEKRIKEVQTAKKKFYAKLRRSKEEMDPFPAVEY